MVTKRKPAYKLAFDQYVGLVNGIEGVRCVALEKGPPIDLTIFIDTWDDDVLDLLADAQGMVLREHLDIEFDSHVIGLDGRAPSDWDISEADLVYSKPTNVD